MHQNDKVVVGKIASTTATTIPLCGEQLAMALTTAWSAEAGETLKKATDLTNELAPGSDIDFLVEFEPLSPGTYADTYFDLLEALEQLFGRSVDLVVASAIKNPYFRESVERTKALVYAA